MKIAVIGAGAMGSLFGGRLALAGNDVCLIDVDKDHIAAVRKDGLLIQSESTIECARPRAGLAHEFNDSQDFLIVFTKSVHTDEALSSVRHLIDKSTWVLTAQNGLGNVEKIVQHVPFERVAIGTTNHAAGLAEPGRVKLYPGGELRIWSANGTQSDAVDNLSAAMVDSGIKCVADPQVEVAIWEKVAFNAAINPLCSISKYPVGGIGEYPAGRTLAALIITEVSEVARARGIPMDKSRVESLAKYAFEHHREHQPSMLRDILAGRATEIESINGAVVAEARKLGMKVPVNETLLNLVRLVERSPQA